MIVNSLDKMKQEKITGKTYTLYRDRDISDYFYEDLREVTNSIIEKLGSKIKLIDFLRKNSANKRSLRREIKINPGETMLGSILFLTEDKLSKYFTDIDSHLNNLPLSKKCGSSLNTSREQYLLYMIEIELVNRLNKDKFNSAGTKFAFLPH